jgi:glyoxylase-like metal-dependent hydrolase (beta-lactamase superfamily II)
VSELLSYANEIIDTRRTDLATNRPTQQLSVLADDLAVVESFSHSWVVRTSEGLVVFDASGALTGPAVVAAIRTWTTDPVHTLVYTHGHVDHVGGVGAFLADADERGHQRPRCLGHVNIARRFARYRSTNAYNVAINARQFAPSRRRVPNVDLVAGTQFLPGATPDPDATFDDTLTIVVGGERFILRHDLGETDDHAWTEWEGRDTLLVGDMLIWNFPNCGNPQKVLRFPAEWAAALRKMSARRPQLVGPAHGLPIEAPDRTTLVLDSTAEALEQLVAAVIELLNADATLDDALHSVRVPEATLALPWLRPLYDEPEFVVRNIWRTYGGWWDRNPAHLLPPRQTALAAEVADLAGGATVLSRRALTLLSAGDSRLAAELVEMAALAEPSSHEVHESRMHVYAQLRREASSLMAKGIFQAASRESAAIAGIEPPDLPRTPPI